MIISINKILFFLFLITCIAADEHSHEYQDNEQVVLWMDTVKPYFNRQETYPYYDLPYCRGPKTTVEHAHETLGEALQGTELVHSGIDIRFKVDVPTTSICQIQLDQSALDSFTHAVSRHYWYTAHIDDLPIFNPVGQGDLTSSSSTDAVDKTAAIWTHLPLDIEYNGRQIVKVSTSGSGLTKIALNAKVNFTYSVKWYPSTIKFNERYDQYLDHSFFQHRIHWYSILNSSVMVVFLVFVVCLILMRTLRRDYARYTCENGMTDLDRELGEEYGWKQIHTDVFRPPRNSLLLSSLVGSGAQIAATSALVLIITLSNQSVFIERGGLLSLSVFVFAATSPVNGMVGGSLFAQYAPGKQWTRQLLLGALLLPGLISAGGLLVNCVAIYYRSTRAIPFPTLLAVASIILFLILPLHLVGTLVGRNLWGAIDQVPCRVGPVPKPIPEKKWFMQPFALVMAGGLLPFGTIFIELYFIFSSFWAYKIYFVFGFTLLVLILLAAVTCSITTVGVYFLLNAEDYRWHWTSFASGASISVYAYLYSTYYFFFKTKMSGFFQTTFYFTYMALFCIALGLMCGMFSFMAAKRFVRKIYSVIKVD